MKLGELLELGLAWRHRERSREEMARTVEDLLACRESPDPELVAPRALPRGERDTLWSLIATGLDMLGQELAEAVALESCPLTAWKLGTLLALREEFEAGTVLLMRSGCEKPPERVAREARLVDALGAEHTESIRNTLHDHWEEVGRPELLSKAGWLQHDAWWGILSPAEEAEREAIRVELWGA